MINVTVTDLWHHDLLLPLKVTDCYTCRSKMLSGSMLSFHFFKKSHWVLSYLGVFGILLHAKEAEEWGTELISLSTIAMKHPFSKQALFFFNPPN